MIDFIHGRTNIWSWPDPTRQELPTASGSGTSPTRQELPTASGSRTAPVNDGDLIDLINSLENVELEHDNLELSRDEGNYGDIISGLLLIFLFNSFNPPPFSKLLQPILINWLTFSFTARADGNSSDEDMMDIDAEEAQQEDPLSEYIQRMNLSPVSPPVSVCSASPAAPPPSPTPSEVSTVLLDPNFYLVGQMLRHMEDRHLLSIQWTPSTTIHKAGDGIFVQFLHGIPWNPYVQTSDVVRSPTASHEEYVDDIRDHMNDIMWTQSEFVPYVTIYRLNVRHVLAVFAALPKGLPMQAQPITWPQKEYIFSITTM